MPEINNIFPDISFDDIINYSHKILQDIKGVINLNPIYSRCSNLNDAKFFMFDVILSKNSSDYYMYISDPNLLNKPISKLSDHNGDMPISSVLVSHLLKD